MRRLTSVLLTAAVLTVGCAKSAPVDVAMVSAHDQPTQFAFVPQYIDVRHGVKGWQRVPLATSANKMELLEYGHQVRLATSNLPKGEYSAVRIGYLVPVADDARLVRTTSATRATSETDEVRKTTRTRSLGDIQLQQQELTILRAFCVDRRGEDNALTLQIFRAHPAHPEEGPSVSIVQSPGC